MIHLFSYISYNKTLGSNHYADINDAPVSDLLRQASINTENQLMVLSDSSWQDFPDTVVMALAHFRMLIHEFFNKDQDIVP